MALKSVSKSTNRNLTTLERVKRSLEIPFDDASQDRLLQDYIEDATDFIENWTERTFARDTVEETLGSDGTPLLMVNRVPLQSVQFIEFDGSSIASTSYEIDDPDAGIIFRSETFDDTRMFRHTLTREPTRFSRKQWKVKYDAGYRMPGSTGRDLPRDVERAAIELVKQWWFDTNRNQNVIREEIGETRVDYREVDFESEGTLAGLPSITANVIRKYAQLD